MTARRLEQGDEPIAGYSLDAYLGQGGFGEVWRATGPGGVPVALKIIHDLDRKKGGKELRALQLLKRIGHPNLVPLTGFWLRTSDGKLISDECRLPEESRGESDLPDDARGTMLPAANPAKTLTLPGAAELIIAMGLCEKSLFDRLLECQQEGFSGVPIAELLTYMEDSARAVDLLNTQHEIQHCDIKPQNILLLSGAAQVADFGLAKVIGDVRESSMGAGTIAYGAPEVLLGAGPTATTDQYSLAISYFELRTGGLPFGSESISEVLNAKQHGSIDLDQLPAAEREVIARAANVDPEKRFASCVEMVQALRAAVSNGDTTPNNHARTIRTGAKRRLRTREFVGLALALLVLAGIAGAVALAASANRKTVEPRDGAEQVVSAESVTDERGDSALMERTPVSTEASEDLKEIIEPSEQSGPDTHEIVDSLETQQRTTEQIAEATARTAENTKQIAEATREISLSLEAIRRDFAKAKDSLGLIADPRAPSDFYHNARMYEQRGDYLNARRSYASLLAFNLNVIDPHLQYQRLIRLQDGRAAAREIYADFTPEEDDLAARFATLLTAPANERVAGLQRFVDEHPSYTPAIYYLSVEYSKDKLGAQALADMAKEKQLLSRFEQLVDDGQLLRHFLDQSLAMTLVEDSRERLAALQQLDESVFENPVRITTMLSNSSWTINLIIPEASREIFYRWDGEDRFESTGFNSFVDQRTGRPMPMPSLQLSLQAKSRKLFVKYVDVRGNEQGPFELQFDPDSERVRSGKQILERLPQSWVSFREFNGESLVYFSHLVSHRHAISEIRYGIDADKPTKLFPLNPADPNKPHAVSPGSLMYISVPPATRLVTVQLTYRDGTRSKLQRFERTPTPQAQASPPNSREEREHAAPTNAADPQPDTSSRNRQGPTRNSGRLRDNIGVDVDVDPSFRRAPRVRFGFGF